MYFRLGQIDQAVKTMERALQIDPDDALVLYNVACIYAQLGENEQALDCLERSYQNAVSTDSLNWMQEDPYFDPVRDHPRYLALVAKLEG